MNRFRWWYRKWRTHKKIQRHFISQYYMKLMSLYTGIPINIFYGTEAGELKGGQLTTSLYNELDYKRIEQEFLDMNKRLLNKWFGERSADNY
jgi:hypothetical protein